MKSSGILALAAVAALLMSCKKAESPSVGAPTEPETVAVTHYTDRTELFMEYPPLVAGGTSRFAVHLTDLVDFKPVGRGQVKIELRRSDGRISKFVSAQPSKPGIFAVDVTVTDPGNYSVSVELRSGALVDIHELLEITVHAGKPAAVSTPQQLEATIPFLKEQQWTLDFATQTVGERTMRDSLRVAAEIQPRTGGAAEVTVPFTARLVLRGDLPALGTNVTKGQILGGLLPPTSNPAELPALELARAEALAALELAGKDLARLERLLAVGAIPLRRVEEARAVRSTATARLKAAENRIAQYEATRVAEDGSPGAPVFLLRAPISGVIADTHATSGANVEAGENLFKIIDVENVYVVGHVPEAEVGRLGRVVGAELEFPVLQGPSPAGRPISVGRLLDPQSRTAKIIYEFHNRGRILAVGQSGFLRVFTSRGERTPAVPESAVVDDAGRPIIFVQLGGEAFARRPVTVGLREGGYVQILEGVRVGERIVVRGAHLIRLAALSVQVPTHGHVH